MADHFYVYPSYLSGDTSRSLGRRVPQPSAVGAVTLDELVAAARTLGFTADPELEKHYPRRAHLFEGRVKVAKRTGTSKARFLVLLAEELRKTHPAHRKG